MLTLTFYTSKEDMDHSTLQNLVHDGWAQNWWSSGNALTHVTMMAVTTLSTLTYNN